MRHSIISALLLGGAAILSACSGGGTDVSRAVSMAAENEAGSIREIMLTVAEPREAIAYFRRRAEEEPRDISHRRDLARSLVRGNRSAEAVIAWQRIVDDPASGHEDREELAAAFIRSSDWAAAKAALDEIPPTHETFQRYRLEALVADSNRQWDRADAFYETAIALTTTPSAALNNWGYSKLTRGDALAAERLFIEAITYDDKLFTAKNNLVLARATRRTYAVPGIPLTEEERAQLMHTAALAAIRQGDVDIGRNMLQDAIATHPRHFEPAVRALRALES